MANILEKTTNVTFDVERIKSDSKQYSAEENYVGTRTGKKNSIRNTITNVLPTNCSTQKRLYRRGVKEKPDHPERVLFCLGLKNPLRTFCITIVDSKYVIYVNIFFYLVLNKI